MPTDSNRAERHRIGAVYRSYDEDGSTRRWDADQPGNAAILAERSHAVEQLFEGVAEPARTLELGCGTGKVLAELPIGGGLRLGVDVLGSRLRQATGSGRVLSFVRADGVELPLAGSSIDLAVAFTLFSSVLENGIREEIAHEVTRVVRPGGHLLWYDLRRTNPRNRQVRPVTRRELGTLFPDWTVEVTSCTLLPPLARRLGPTTSRCYRHLARLGFLRTHLVGLLTRPG